MDEDTQVRMWAASLAMDAIKAGLIGFDQVPEIHRLLVGLVILNPIEEAA